MKVFQVIMETAFDDPNGFPSLEVRANSQVLRRWDIPHSPLSSYHQIIIENVNFCCHNIYVFSHISLRSLKHKYISDE